MLFPQLLTHYLSLQLLKVQQAPQLAMYPGAFENMNEQFEKSSFGLLEKSQFLTLMNVHDMPRNNPIECNFQDIFLTSIAPNCSTISNCTQEDRNFDVFSLPDEFFGESVDHFLEGKPEEKDMPCEDGELRTKIAPEEKKILQEAQLKQEEGEKEEEPQNCHDETKNIPKNYIKAIFAFILQDQEYMKKLINKLYPKSETASEEGNELERFIDFVRQEKKVKKYTIQRLKNLWTNPQNGKAMRIISCEFLRRRSMGYIFGSKIEKKMTHIKHRYKFIRAIQNPVEFSSIK